MGRLKTTSRIVIGFAIFFGIVQWLTVRRHRAVVKTLEEALREAEDNHRISVDRLKFESAWLWTNLENVLQRRGLAELLPDATRLEPGEETRLDLLDLLVRQDEVEKLSHEVGLTEPTAGQLFSAANANAAIGNTVKAEELYLEAVNCDPDLTDAYYNRAHVLASLGRYEDALDALERAAETDGSYSDLARTDSAFDVCRTHPRFQALIGEGV